MSDKLSPVLPRSSPRRIVVLAALAVAAGACGAPPQSGVDTKSLTTDLVYGIPSTPEPAPPANTAAEPENPTGVEVFSGTPQDLGPRLPRPKAETCPPAPLTEAPPPATSRVGTRPQEGVYRWVFEGTREIAGGNRIPLFPFQDRAIQNVETTATGFEFTTVETDQGSRDRVFTTYEVRDPEAEGDNAGVYLLQIQRQGPQRETTFSPAPPVLMLPLPAQVDGTTFRSIGVDPVSQEVLSHTGEIVERKRVDACGDWVDGWLVDGAQTFARADGGVDERNFDYAVATQLGGIPVFEHVQSPCAPNESNECPDDLSLNFEARLGQVEPRRREDD